MVITVTCPSCSSSFPVDPAKVPPKGVNARCSACGDIFRVEKPAPAPAFKEPELPPPPQAPAFKEPELPPPLPEPTFGGIASLDDVQVVPEPAAPMPPPRVPGTPAAAAPAAEPAAPEKDAGFRFGKRDPTDKAKRLARVLVSDMIMYNAERHATALENNTIPEDFEEEIDKSWKEFVEQVGPEMADGQGRGFWTDALNDILAKGDQLF